MSKQKVIGLVMLGILITVGAFAFGRNPFHTRPIVRPTARAGAQQRDESHTLPPSDTKAVRPDSAQQDDTEVKQSATSITGRVVDAEGKPVAGAIVTALKTDFLSGYLPSDLTNERGEFEILISNSKPGVYRLHAGKREDGYPQIILGSFYKEAAGTELDVVVNAQQVTQDVEIRLGQKVGSIVGRVIDAETHKPANNALITLRRLDDPQQFSQAYAGKEGENGAGKFKLLTPLVPFTVEVKAPGYERWTYSEDNTGKHASPIQVAEREKKELTVALQPIK